MAAKEKKILIVTLGLVVFALAYFFGYRPLKEKRETLNAENATLRTQYEDLSIKAGNAEMYQKEIKKMQVKMQDIFGHYPSMLQTENEIMDAVKIETETKSFISALNVADPVAVEIVMEGQNAAEQPAEGETQAQTSVAMPYQLYDVNSTISFESGYEEMKQLVEMVAKDEMRKSVQTLSINYNVEDGKITGNMSYDTYFVHGLDKPYVEPNVPGMRHGVKNIFGTVDTSRN